MVVTILSIITNDFFIGCAKRWQGRILHSAVPLRHANSASGARSHTSRRFGWNPVLHHPAMGHPLEHRCLGRCCFSGKRPIVSDIKCWNVVHFTALFLKIMLTALLVRWVRKPGAVDGIRCSTSIEHWCLYRCCFFGTHHNIVYGFKRHWKGDYNPGAFHNFAKLTTLLALILHTLSSFNSHSNLYEV